MKNSILVIAIVGIAFSFILAAYLTYPDDPKTPWECRMEYGKVKQDIQNCLDQINNEKQKFFQNNNIMSKSGIESDFLNKIREDGDDTEPMTFTIISKQGDHAKFENYCGHAHMAVEEYWYFADVYDGGMLNSNVTQHISPWCEDDDEGCYCELREVIGVDRRSYEDFFREHASATCPIVPMPESVSRLSFDPAKCEWIENEN